jgi:hypothetical protein
VKEANRPGLLAQQYDEDHENREDQSQRDEGIPIHRSRPRAPAGRCKDDHDRIRERREMGAYLPMSLRFVLLLIAMLALTGCPGPNYAPYDNMRNSYG